MQRIMILGVTGMLGSALARLLCTDKELEVWGTCRRSKALDAYTAKVLGNRLIEGIDAMKFETVAAAMEKLRPDCVINCIGIVKQLPIAKEPVPTITINALFPHQVEELTKTLGSRMIHVSTDCVFTGKKGNYAEQDEPDAEDLYGKTKALGEVVSPHCVTIRTSIIGHELRNGLSLIEWFLAQKGSARGYTGAIYSGFPTVELSEILQRYVIPDKRLSGLYQVSSDPISKYELLKLVAKQYRKDIAIEPWDGVRDNKTLDSTRFRQLTGYKPPKWSVLVEKMHRDYLSWKGTRD